MGKHELWELQSMQAAPLNVKVMLTKQRIRDWVHEYGQDGVYVSFSGGKDSTVLLHLVRELYPDIPAVYCNTGLEYPEITQFVKTFDNVTILKPKMSFFKVCEKYGFPLISKEVSECVSGARKYLKQVLTSMPESEIALTDRQTDRARNGITRSIDSYVDKASIAELTRQVSLKIQGGGVRQEVQKTQRNRRVPFRWEWEKLNGIGQYGKRFSNAKLGGWRSQRLCQSYWNPNVYATHCLSKTLERLSTICESNV